MNPVLAWCPRCGGYVRTTVVKQPLHLVTAQKQSEDDPGESYPAALIECEIYHHALLAIGYDHDE